MKKLVRDGKVAVLYSPGFGIGWYNDHGYEELVFHPKLVELVEQNKQKEITKELVKDILVNEYGYKSEFIYVYGGVKQLKIEWITEGCLFEIDEYDGSESIHVIGDRSYLRA